MERERRLSWLMSSCVSTRSPLARCLKRGRVDSRPLVAFKNRR